MASSTLTLWFQSSADGTTLERVEFQSHSGGERIVTARGDRFNRRGKGYAWTKAMRALSVLFIRHACSAGEGEVTGDGSSPARTLFNVLEHPERSAAAVPFTESCGLCHLRALMECVNLGRSIRGDAVHQIVVNGERLPKAGLSIFLDGQPPSLAMLRDSLSPELSKAWPDWSAPDPLPEASPIRDLGGFAEDTNEIAGRDGIVMRLVAKLLEGRSVNLHGPGGRGKTAVLSALIRKASEDGRPELRKIFGWTFLPGEPPETCFEALAEFVGCDLTSETGPYAQGRQLAMTAARAGAIVVLDDAGLLSTKQPGDRDRAEFFNRGFLSVSDDTGPAHILVSRAPLPEFKGECVYLDPVAAADAVEILISLGVVGQLSDLKRVALRAGGCPLAVRTVAGYVTTSHQGFARALAEENFWLENMSEEAKRCREIVETEAAELEDTCMQALLEILSCLESGMTLEEFAEFLFHGPLLAEAKEYSFTMAGLKNSFVALGRRGLMAQGEKIVLHPVAKAIFRSRFRTRCPDLHRAAHSWLYDSVVGNPGIPEYPSEPDDYERLLAALWHGREAGRLAEAWREVTWRRIMREGVSYRMTAELGEFQLCLRSWAAFWDVAWQRVHPTLPLEAHPIVTASAGFALFMVDRCDEAEYLLKRVLSRSFRRVRPDHAIQPAVVLGFIRCRQGRLTEARRLLRPVATVARWLGPATRSPDHVLLTPVCYLAFAHQKQGDSGKAERLFGWAVARTRRSDGFPLPPQLLVLRWEAVILAGRAREFDDERELAEEIDRIPLLHQFGSVPFLRSLSAWAGWLEKGNIRDLERAREQSDIACERTATSGYRNFHFYHLRHRARILADTGDEQAAALDRGAAERIGADLGIRT